MGLQLFTCQGGSIVLPDRQLVLVDRQTGGNLVINPPREVWERSELTATELTHWSFLVAATGKAMLDVLPQLAGGCLNYWEAGNWALHDEAEPKGAKTAPEHRRVHLHLLGRSRTTNDPSWRWGEAPVFPTFAERHAWAASNERLIAAECRDIVARVETLLMERYGTQADQIADWFVCVGCGYPTPLKPPMCVECQLQEPPS